MAKQIVNAKEIQGRSHGHATFGVVNWRKDDLEHEAQKFQVEFLGTGIYRVKSGVSGETYTVRMDSELGSRCSCDWAKYRPADDKRCACSHVIAVWRRAAKRWGYTISVWTDKDEALRQKRKVRYIGDGVWLTFRKAYYGT